MSSTKSRSVKIECWRFGSTAALNLFSCSTNPFVSPLTQSRAAIARTYPTDPRSQLFSNPLRPAFDALDAVDQGLHSLVGFEIDTEGRRESMQVEKDKGGPRSGGQRRDDVGLVRSEKTRRKEPCMIHLISTYSAARIMQESLTLATLLWTLEDDDGLRLLLLILPRVAPN